MPFLPFQRIMVISLYYYSSQLKSIEKSLKDNVRKVIGAKLNQADLTDERERDIFFRAHTGLKST